MSKLPPPIVIPCASASMDDLLSKEWLLANKLGSFASSTPLGCNTRRYHGLLIAATLPPVKRISALSSLMEQLTVDGQAYALATNEFTGAFSPNGQPNLVEFRNDVVPTYVFRAGGVELIKEIVLAESANAVAVRYTLCGGSAKLSLLPMVALRDYHSLRKVSEPHQMTYERMPGGVMVQDRMRVGNVLHIVSEEAKFEPRPQWWYNFLYRQDIARGQEGMEDLYTPGAFTCELHDGQSCQVTASLDEAVAVKFDTTAQRRRERMEELVAGEGEDADETSQRLAIASDAYVVMRSFPNAPASPTIVAGYPWFTDWGRDTFIALPGLLLSTGRFDVARGVFKTFASHVHQGMVPNVFDDYSANAHYNSIDASLWFVLAAERYVQATGDTRFWRDTLMTTINAILTAYGNGTMFDIRADADGLIAGGSPKTQLTWMDAKLGDEVITPRHGKAVEINALWYCAHRIMADRCRMFNRRMAEHYEQQAEIIAPAFRRAFWNEAVGWLNDCVTDGWPDASLRPNQIFAVSLPYSPLTPEQQAAVLKAVQTALLTPMGLRTLSPFDSRYRRRYGGSWESRDRAYHQGTVWAWLIGPFIEAYLKVNHNSTFAVSQAKQWLAPFDEHLRQAGIGHISEIFDGDAPHAPAGCFAQAWSVAEVLRAKRLVAQCKG